jgi:hypothetical protein
MFELQLIGITIFVERLCIGMLIHSRTEAHLHAVHEELTEGMSRVSMLPFVCKLMTQMKFTSTEQCISY